MRTITLLGLIIIALVVAIDQYYLVKYANVLNELNPICCYILSKGGLELLVALKTLTTFLVLGFCWWAYQFNPRFMTIIVTGVAVFQTGLLWFLLFA